MKKGMLFLAVGTVALFGFVPLAFAQEADISPAAARPVVYKLSGNAAYAEGCFEGCACPISLASNFRGTFTLRPTGGSGTAFTYAVDDVNWWADRGGEIRITGSGRYTRISGFAGWLHRLELQLSINGAAPVRFDSGLVNGGGDFPRITDIVISMNGLYCYDIAITVNAAPVPRKELLCYTLGRESNYQEGCLPPCLCPIFVDAALQGSFALVELQDFGTYIEYAVVNVNWRVVSPYDPPSSSFVGFGRYTRISGIAGWIHQMELELHIDGGPLTHFDSGLVDGGGEFPTIDIALAMNGFYCYDIVLDILARPCPVAAAITPAGIE